jgi:hypothetical protein
MQTSTTTVWKIVRTLLVLAAAVYAVLALFSIYVVPTQYKECERDTKYLNGGERVYAGRKYKIVLCGAGGDENFMHDEMRMQIFSESGNLLAQRKFYVDWNGLGPIKLVYGDDHLIYADLSDENDYKRKVTMPPTWLDWIRARLPLVD